ncbi:MAG: MFS transporter [Proteobacteria bacterium]|nr:MFS transporter [Pseudomonadota bacterium]
MADAAFRFVLTIGIVNLFADLTYEGGASINGAFMGSLGASAAVISIVAGLGEFLGYSLRSVAGYVADRTGRHWSLTFLGYTINLLAVPAMALAGNWPVAAALILAERIGRALRKPTVEAMLSYTTGKHGKGWVYAVNTALDETGATLGPLVAAAVLFFKGSYQNAYAMLLLSTLLALATLTVARLRFPVPAALGREESRPEQGFRASYWLYMCGAACFAAGLTSYELISYHLTRTGIIAPPWIPVLLAFATGSGVIANLVLGKSFDRFGLPVLLAATVLSALFTPLALITDHWWLVIAAMPLLGIGYAVQDTLLKAVVAGMLPEGRRDLAFGLFYTGYGGGWLVGSIAMGLLYDNSREALVAIAVAAQLAALPVFWVAERRRIRG